jgi:hypothetical protein
MVFPFNSFWDTGALHLMLSGTPCYPGELTRSAQDVKLLRSF